MERKTVSIRIDPKLWKDARKYAIDNDLTIGKLLEKILRKEIKSK